MDIFKRVEKRERTITPTSGFELMKRRRRALSGKNKKGTASGRVKNTPVPSTVRPDRDSEESAWETRLGHRRLTTG